MHISTNSDNSEILDTLAEFIAYDKDNYGTGMSNLALAYLNKEKALNGRCAFFDPAYVNGNVRSLNRELAGQSSPYLVTASINVYANENLAPDENRNAHLNLLQNTLTALDTCSKSFNKIFIPIGCQEENKPGHNIALVLEKDRIGYKATILDQMGGSSYADSKARIIQDLTSVGIVNIDYNRYPMSNNRNDCATFTSLLAEYACDGYDMREFSQDTDASYRQNGLSAIPNNIIDDQHDTDQNTLLAPADRIAENLIKETFEVNSLDRLRGLSDVPSPREVVVARIQKYYNAFRGIFHSGNNLSR